MTDEKLVHVEGVWEKWKQEFWTWGVINHLKDWVSVKVTDIIIVGSTIPPAPLALKVQISVNVDDR
jgi:hypothetical protein